MINVKTGFLLALQFFTVIPVKRSYPMNDRTVPWMIASLPLIGGLIGSLTLLSVWLFQLAFDPGPVMLTFFIWLSVIIWTGGLHLDGWTDVSDAFFSYRDQSKRQEILKDPRTGAFGALSLFVLLIAKGVFLYELVTIAAPVTLIWVMIVSRTVIAVQLLTARHGGSGTAAFLRSHSNRRDLWKPLAISSVLLAVPLLITPAWPLLLLITSGAIIAGIWSARFFTKQFGGISGDTLGATVEGGELWSILIVWCYLSIATG